MIQLQDVYDSFSRNKQDISDVDTDTFIEWCNFAHKYIYKKLKKIDPERVIQEQDYHVASPPENDSLPDDFRDINQTTCGIYVIDSDGNPTDEKIGITGYGRRQIGYYLNGSDIIFTDESETVDKDYMMRYIPKLTSFTALTDYFTIDSTDDSAITVEDEDLEYLVKAVDVLYEQWDQNPGAESVADFRFVRAMGEMFDSYNRTPQVSTIYNPSQDY